METLGHELLHAGQSPLGAGAMVVEDWLWGRFGFERGYIHDHIAAQAARIRAGLPLR